MIVLLLMGPAVRGGASTEFRIRGHLCICTRGKRSVPLCRVPDQSGLYLNFCPPIEAAYIKPPFATVNTAIPL
jgi:hypothetical protein